VFLSENKGADMSFLEFLNDEDAAVTVDWVVLTAALVALVVATFAMVNGGVTNLADEIAAVLAALLT
jgi:hypothetical protein